MNDKRLKNLYDALTSHIDYGNYMETYGEDKVDLLNINYNLLISIFSGYYLTTILDPFIEKDSDNNVTINIIPEFIDYYASIIAVNNGAGYTIGELSYKDATTVIDKVRNKLAHGDFIVDGNEIVFEENGAKGRINIDSLTIMIGAIDNQLRFIKSEGSTTIVSANQKYVQNKKVVAEPSFKKYCKDLLVMFIEDKPKEGKKRTLQYKDFVAKMVTKLSKIFFNDELNDTNLKKLIEVNKPFLDLLNIDLTFKAQTAYDLNYYDVLKSNYLDNKEFIDMLPQQLLTEWILSRITKLNRGQFQTFNYSKGILLNICVLRELRNHPGYRLEDVILNNPELNYTFFIDMDNAIIALNLVGFNSFYQFGLEKGLTLKGNYDLAKVASGESLDFSKLDLELLDDPNMDIEHEFECYDNDVNRYESKTPSFESRIDSINDNLCNYLEHTKEEDISIDKINKFRNRLNETIDEYKEHLYTIEQMKEFSKSFDKEKYVRNINIVEHIRNAIAHGTIYVDEYSSPSNPVDKLIIIKDIYEGRVTYEKKLTVKQFASLFKMDNFYLLNEFMENNFEDKSLINPSYIYTLNERINNRKK